MIEKIISYSGFDQVGDFDSQFYDAEFKIDFGPWKKGQKISTIGFLFNQGIVVEYGADGRVEKQCKIKIVPR